jgi:hypothetical protein
MTPRFAYPGLEKGQQMELSGKAPFSPALLIAYSTSKGAWLGLTRSIATNYGRVGSGATPSLPAAFGPALRKSGWTS